MYNKNNVKNEFLTPSGKLDIRKCTWKRVRKNQELYDFMIGYFDDVDESIDVREVLYRIENDVYEIPKCKWCGEHNAEFSIINYCYKDYCSEYCRCKLKEFRKNGLVYEYADYTIEHLKEYIQSGKTATTRLDICNIMRNQGLYKFFRNYIKDNNIDTTEMDTFEIFYRIVNGIKGNERPLCPYCGKHRVKFVSYSEGYREYCSVECARNAHNDKSHQEKLKRDEKHNVYTKDNILSYFIDKNGYCASIKTNWKWIKTYDMNMYHFLINYYPNIDENYNVLELLYRIVNDIDTIPMCKQCKKHPTKFHNFEKGYRDFCSPSCVATFTYLKRKSEGCYKKYTEPKIKKERVKKPKKKPISSAEKTLIKDMNTTYTYEMVMDMTIRDDGGIKSLSWTFLKNRPNLKKFIMEFFGVDELCEGETRFAEWIYRMKHHIMERPICPICNEHYLKYKNGTDGYFFYCSIECANTPKAREITKQKAIKTFNEKYNVDWYMQSDEGKERVENTNMTKYGVKSTLLVPEVKAKCDETNIRLYGVANPINTPEIAAKREKTNLERYGVINPLMNSEIYQKGKETLRKNYNVDVPLKSPIIQERAKATNRERYGADWYLETDEFAEKYRDYLDNRTEEQIQHMVNACKDTLYERTGYRCTFEIPEVKARCSTPESIAKGRETMKRLGKIGKSQVEDDMIKYLIDVFGEDDVERNYRSERYPYNCDAYIKSLDAFIELQGYFTHGFHPYGYDEDNDEKLLKHLQERLAEGHESYKSYIETWTVKDVKKRNIAKEQGLNYFEIFSRDYGCIITAINENLKENMGYVLCICDDKARDVKYYE